jgi:hypothetical protein
VTPNRKLIAWVVAGIAVAGIAFVAGRELRPASSEVSAFDLNAPVYETGKLAVGYSKAGFTGFGETPGPDGRTVLTGRVVAIDERSITVEAGGQRSTVRVSAETSVKRIEAAAASSLRPGASVLIRLSAGRDEATGILITGEP